MQTPPIARQIAQQPSPMLRLPHEVLLMIACGVVAQHDPVSPHAARRFRKGRVTKSSSPLIAVLLACRALYFAGIEAFYGRNRLQFEQAEHLRHFVDGLSYDQRWAITAIELKVEWMRKRRGSSEWLPQHEGDYCSRWKGVVEELPRLRSIIIRNYAKGNSEQFEEHVGSNADAFESRMREEMGSDTAGMLRFVWTEHEQMLEHS